MPTKKDQVSKKKTKISMTNARRNIFLIPLAFFFIFFGFGTAQQYLVILFSTQGRGHLALSVLFILYGTFLFISIVVAKIIPWLGGLKKSLLAGAFTYFLFVGSVAINNTALLYIASVLIGIGAGLLWVSSDKLLRIVLTSILSAEIWRFK